MRVHNTNCFFSVSHIYVAHSLAVLALVGTTIFASGCGKKSTTEKSPSVPAETATLVSATTPVAGPPVAQKPPLNSTTQVITADANTGVVLEKLSLELRRYVAYTRTIPKSFEEFASHNSVQFPTPPAGKIYAIDQGKVILQSK